MLTNQREWNKSFVGMIHWSDYWGKYSLVLDVDLKTMTISELDKFGEIGHGAAIVRKHFTAIADRDRFYTLEEFFRLIRTNIAVSKDVNGRVNTWRS